MILNWIVEFRLLRKLQLPLRRVLIPPKKPRFGTEPPSRDQLASSKRDLQRTSWKLLSQWLLSISMLLSSTHCPVSPPSRPSKTATLLFSSSTRKPIRKWSRKLALNFITSRSRKLTLWLLQRVRRRPTLLSHQTKTPLMLPTKSESCEEFGSPCQGDKWTAESMDTEKLSYLWFKAKWNQWFNQSKAIRFSV